MQSNNSAMALTLWNCNPRTKISFAATIDFAHDKSLEESNDVALGESFARALRHVVLGRLVMLDANTGSDSINRGVGLAVAIPGKPMLSRHAQRRWHGCNPAEFGERRFGINAVRIIASDDEYLSGCVRTNAEGVAER
jgi:hypothetical protein